MNDANQSHVNDKVKREQQPADKKRAEQSELEGPAAYALHEDEKDINKQLSPAAPGEDRTPDRTIGVIKHAVDDAKK